MKKSYLLGIALLGASIFTARADIIPTLASVTPGSGDFQWNYSANVTVDEMVRTGDFFTIYDFGSISPGSNTQPAGWTFSTSLIGVTPSRVLPTDNPSTLNLTWTYTGQETINGGSFLGMFSVVTTTDQLRTSDFAAEATRSTGPNVGTKVDNVGNIAVPVPEMSALAPMIGICGLGMVGFATSLLRRRQAAK